MFKYSGELIEDKIQHWAMTHQPDDNKLYKESFWKHIVFIRDDIIGNMFYYPLYADLNIPYSEISKRISSNYEIVGTHWSKSIELPVICMKYKDSEIVFRYNFYDFEITVISNKNIELPNNLFKFNNKYFYYQGFPDEYKINIPYPQSKKKFSITINNPCNYSFYTLMFLLKSELDKE